MLNSRRIEDLKPYVAFQCRTLIARCKAVGINLIVTGTLRDQEYQNECFRKGTGPKLLGPHGYGLAFDVVPVVNGKAVWGNVELWRRIAAIGKSLGLEWGGDWKHRVDCPHFQFTGGLKDAQIRAGKLPKFPPIPTAISENKEDDILSKYQLAPICYGALKDTQTLDCKEEPSNHAETNATLKKYIHKKFPIYAKTENEGIQWYLININPKLPQWVAARFVQII